MPYDPSPSLRSVAVDDPDEMLIAQWAQAMAAGNLSPRTITERTNLVRRAARLLGVAPQDISAEQVSAFLAGTSHGARPTYFAHLHAWFVWLARWDHRADIPTIKVGRPKPGRRQPRTISTGHMGALVERPGQWRRTRTMVVLGAYAGMRASEIAAMRGEQIDKLGGEIVIHGKGDVTRAVPLHPALLREAEMYGRGWWFPSYTRSGPVRATSVSKTISDLMERSGVPGTCHDLRRWFASTMAEAGHPVSAIQAMLGHVSLATTQRYLVVGRQVRVDAVLSLPDLTAGSPAA